MTDIHKKYFVMVSNDRGEKTHVFVPFEKLENDAKFANGFNQTSKRTEPGSGHFQEDVACTSARIAHRGSMFVNKFVHYLVLHGYEYHNPVATIVDSETIKTTGERFHEAVKGADVKVHVRRKAGRIIQSFIPGRNDNSKRQDAVALGSQV